MRYPLIFLLSVASVYTQQQCEESRRERCYPSCPRGRRQTRGQCLGGGVCCSRSRFLYTVPTTERKKIKFKPIPGEKSAKYCKEYTKLSIEYLHIMPLLPEVRPVKIKVDNCPPKFTPLIVGGKNATEGEFPHMAALGYYRNDDIDYLCGGTLISVNFILTAAHCTKTRWGPPVVAFVGATVLYSSKGYEMPVADIIIHPKYEPPACYHDIALLKIESGLKLSANLRPACLPSLQTKAQFPGSITIATGWGKLGFGRESSMSLRKVLLKVMDNKKCGEYYESDTKTPSLSEGITPTLLCATGFEDKIHDTCHGDSGGPLQALVPGSECTFQIVGITSFGKACGAAVPGVYTRVAPYISWIEKNVWT